MVGYAADAGRFFVYVALLNMFQVGKVSGGLVGGAAGGKWCGGGPKGHALRRPRCSQRDDTAPARRVSYCRLA